MASQRVHWIDVARGIGIIFVLYAHALNAESYRHLFYAFHMPLFFFLSGITFHVKQYESFWQIVKKSIKNILVPYFLYAALCYIIWYLDVRDSVTTQELQKQFFSIFYGNSYGSRLIFNNILWFLPCLFITRVAFAAITRISTKKRFLLPILFVISIAGYLFSVFYPQIKLFFSAEAAINGVVFFGLGFLWYKYAEEVNTYIKKYAVALIPLLFIICIAAATLNYNWSGHQIDMRLNRLDNYFLFYLAALTGILGVLAVSIAIEKNKTLEYLGKNSLALYVWHLILFGFFAGKMRLLLAPETINAIRNTLLAPLYTTASIIVILSISWIFQKMKFAALKMYR